MWSEDVVQRETRRRHPLAQGSVGSVMAVEPVRSGVCNDDVERIMFGHVMVVLMIRSVDGLLLVVGLQLRS